MPSCQWKEAHHGRKPDIWERCFCWPRAATCPGHCRCQGHTQQHQLSVGVRARAEDGHKQHYVSYKQGAETNLEHKPWCRRYHGWAAANSNSTTPTAAPSWSQGGGERQGLVFQLQTAGLVQLSTHLVTACSEAVIYVFNFSSSLRLLLCPVPSCSREARRKAGKEAYFGGTPNWGWQTLTIETVWRRAKDSKVQSSSKDSLLWPNDSQDYSHTITARHGLYLCLTFKKSYTSAWIFSYIFIAKLLQHQGILYRGTREEKRFGKI